jgi:hypothetical protein
MSFPGTEVGFESLGKKFTRYRKKPRCHICGQPSKRADRISGLYKCSVCGKRACLRHIHREGKELICRTCKRTLGD